MDTSFRWGNNQNLTLPRHTYGTTSNKLNSKKENKKRNKEYQRKRRKKKKKKRKKANGFCLVFMKIHFEYVVD